MFRQCSPAHGVILGVSGAGVGLGPDKSLPNQEYSVMMLEHISARNVLLVCWGEHQQSAQRGATLRTEQQSLKPPSVLKYGQNMLNEAAP